VKNEQRRLPCLCGLIALTMVVCVGVCAGQAQSEMRATGGVAGKVVQEPVGPGIRKVVVQLAQTEGEEGLEYSTSTDGTGAFRFEGVEPGKYTVELARPGYYAAKKSGQEWTVTVEAGKDVADLVYKMQAAGVIAGKINDAEGDPVANVAVDAIRQGKVAAAVTGAAMNEMDAGRAVTNDLGEYRIANLRPGLYEVRVDPTPDLRPPPNPADRGRQKEKAVYTKTYYPGTMEEGQAGAVQVTSGGTATANIGLLTNRAYRVSGTLSGAGAAQMSQIILMSRAGVTAQESVQEGGKFEFQNVQPGTYEARVLLVTGVGEGQRPTMKVETVQTPIVVDGADLAGLDLVVETGGTVKGKLRMDDDGQIDWTQLSIGLVSVPEAGAAATGFDALGAASLGMVPVEQDGTFEVKDVPGGTYQLGVTAKSELYRDYYVKSVTESGREVVDTGFAVTGGAGLDVVVSAKACTIDGTVADLNGKPVVTAEVVAVPASGLRMRPDAYQVEKTNAQGQYALRGMNPGQYLVVALDGTREDPRSAEFLAKYGKTGEQVEVAEGEKKTVGLKVVEAKD
jgi:protocatechuate 3,4-dioxygenase beta subunit